MQKLKETSESKKYFYEIKAVSRDDVSAKMQKQEFCDSVCYKIPYFTDWHPQVCPYIFFNFHFIILLLDELVVSNMVV